MRKLLYGGAAVVCLAACSPQQQAAVASFEAKAAPAIQSGCAKFRAAEADPLVQVATTVGATAATAATGVPIGAAVSAIRSFGDQFCTMGPPPGDATSVAEQAAWIGGVADQLLAAAKGQ